MIVARGREADGIIQNPVSTKVVNGIFWKKPRRYFVSVAKDLGFKPIFVIVRLLENWNVLVQANEL